MYRHRLAVGSEYSYTPGKVVCVGRNYADHAKELGNAVPSSPLLFIKPATAMVAMTEPVALPEGFGACHHELEMALLIGQPLTKAAPDQCRAAIAGIGLALDLTLRELQDELKKKGHPWERAKAFDGACPLSEFAAFDQNLDFASLTLRLTRNGGVQQQGSCGDMLFSVENLLSEISHSFTLMPGDVVLTGTPAGVGPLSSGDQLVAELGDYLRVETVVL
ncbi:fumarylacetoacetate hydrolase family protein [uncultured Zhongshania sp.]|uniref:fumarylacetoacetate hydrolase family protein n=1 Tax=uncultured Zhongshania sp. TaxID=1642288 RepID=UPI0025D8CB87|nr:fumarylacetoacetate hydrolase family protein [uncultured Zhongshania sp.]|tara:strand:- start:84 stop:743 length:660 start_codon:yes stop_codon:yes gene_type:complete